MKEYQGALISKIDSWQEARETGCSRGGVFWSRSQDGEGAKTAVSEATMAERT